MRGRGGGEPVAHAVLGARKLRQRRAARAMHARHAALARGGGELVHDGRDGGRRLEALALEEAEEVAGGGEEGVARAAQRGLGAVELALVRLKAHAQVVDELFQVLALLHGSAYGGVAATGQEPTQRMHCGAERCQPSSASALHGTRASALLWLVLTVCCLIVGHAMARQVSDDFSAIRRHADGQARPAASPAGEVP